MRLAWLKKNHNILNAEPESIWTEFLIDAVKKADQINDMKRQFQSPRRLILKYFKNKTGRGWCRSLR